MAGVREANRERTTAAILAAARAELAEHGSNLSMREVARQVGVVSSAVYRYFPTREALLTAMIIESYGHLAAALDAVEAETPAQRWSDLVRTFRDWSRRAPHEFQLVYGTPLPGYAAPPETVPAAAAVARPFAVAASAGAVHGFDAPALLGQMDVVRELAPGLPPEVAAAVLAELAALVGMVTLELGGHLVGSADPADHLYAALIGRQVATLGLARSSG